MRVLVHLLLWRVGLAQAETQTTPAERDCLARHVSGRKRLGHCAHDAPGRPATVRLRLPGKLWQADPRTRRPKWNIM